MVSVNCSSSITLDKGDFFACECKGEGGNPLADVTWYKDNVLIVSGKEKAIFRFPNVDKDDSGTYRCEAKSGHEKANNETTMELIVNCKYDWYLYHALCIMLYRSVCLLLAAACLHFKVIRIARPESNQEHTCNGCCYIMAKCC